MVKMVIDSIFFKNFGYGLDNSQLMNKAEYLMKNYGDRGDGVIRRGRRPRRITPSEISIILHMIRKPNSIIVLLFIQNNS